MNICQKCRMGAFYTCEGPKLNLLSFSIMCGSGTKIRLKCQEGWELSSSSRPHFWSAIQGQPSPGPSKHLQNSNWPYPQARPAAGKQCSLHSIPKA